MWLEKPLVLELAYIALINQQRNLYEVSLKIP